MSSVLKKVFLYYILIVGLLFVETYKLTHAGDVSSKVTFVYEAF